MRIRLATRVDEASIQMAIWELRAVRRLLKHAGAVKATAAVRRALKSTEGALRHAGHRVRRAEKGVS